WQRVPHGRRLLPHADRLAPARGRRAIRRASTNGKPRAEPSKEVSTENAMHDTKSSIQSKGSLLARDFQNVATDAEELLKAIGREGDAKLVEVKTQLRSSLEETLER